MVEDIPIYALRMTPANSAVLTAGAIRSAVFARAAGESSESTAHLSRIADAAGIG